MTAPESDAAVLPPPPPTVEDAPEDSQTASEWVNSQLQLEAEAREALPYSFDNCTRPLGALRQNVFACLTCHPPPAAGDDAAFTPAGLCYGCSIACHGEHTLVEIFARRDFTCDCGTTRLPSTAPCTLRRNAATGQAGGVTNEEAAHGNTYNHNFRNRFCGCGEWYVAQEQRGTMYQCLGLASEADGGCGEDWWHPECLLGLPRDWHAHMTSSGEAGANDKKKEEEEEKKKTENEEDDEEEEEHPVPPGFPDEDDFDTLICYKCVAATPWLRAYAASQGFMPLKYQPRTTAELQSELAAAAADETKHETATSDAKADNTATTVPLAINTKRKALSPPASPASKRARTSPPADNEPPNGSAAVNGSHHDANSATNGAANSSDIHAAEPPSADQSAAAAAPIHTTLPPPPPGPISILTRTASFRDLFCRCAACYPTLARYPPLLEAEETYHPPRSGTASATDEGGSLLDRGEAALGAVDRVRAIEGVMAYQHLRDQVKAFLQPFAESGRAVGAEDVERYFAQLRGDQEAIRAARRGAEAAGEGNDGSSGGGGGEGNDEGAGGTGSTGRKEQSGY